MIKLPAFTSFFQFTKSQRTALVLLLGAIFLLQGFFWFWRDLPPNKKQFAKWYYVSPTTHLGENPAEYKFTVYPFNPNFISDYKAYKFGMSAREIDRLRAFRKKNLYLNSALEFKQITGVSDSILRVMQPYFKFPDWVNKSTRNSAWNASAKSAKTVVKLDINSATAEDLKKIYGIGDGLSSRILQARQKWGGFVSMQQLNTIWGLSPAVIDQLAIHFEVIQLPDITKIKINSCSFKELLQIPYVNYSIAKSILMYRSKSIQPIGIEDLLKIEQFPVDKINIIALYLEF